MLETLTDAEYNKCKLKEKKRRRKKEGNVSSLCSLIFFSVRKNSLFVKYPNYSLLLDVIDTSHRNFSIVETYLEFVIGTRTFSFHFYVKHLRKISKVFRTPIEDSVTFAYFCYTLLCCLSFCTNCECFTLQSQVYTKRTFFLFSV